MLFLSIIFDDSSSINSTEKSKIILEILGNVKLRPSTAKYVRMRVSILIDICGNEASREEDEPNKLRFVAKIIIVFLEIQCYIYTSAALQ